MAERTTWQRAWLLGAGASKEAGLPLASELTERLLDRQEKAGAGGLALRFVVGQIIAFDSRAGARPDVLPDVERVVSAVELLSARDGLEVAPFVASWDPTVDSIEHSSSGLSIGASTDVRELIRGLGLSAPPYRNARPASVNESTVRRALERLVDKRVGGRRRDAFGGLLAELLRDLVAVVRQSDSGDVAYLKPLARAGADGSPVATLNYDLTVERAAAESNVKCSRGIESWSRTGELKWPTNMMHLYKLHGSIDWAREPAPTGPDQPLNLPRAVISEPPEGTANYKPFLVFGQREKLRAEGPFLQLLEGFRLRLNKSRELIVLGYAFRDGHINELVVRWLAGTPRRRLIVVDPNFPEDSGWGGGSFQHSLLRHLRDQARSTDRQPRPSRVAVIREPASTAIPMLCGARSGEYIEASLVQGEGE